MKIKPLGDRLVLKTLKSEEKTASGIIMPTSAQSKPDYAEIVEISKDLKDKDYKLGDKVLYTKYAGTSIKDGEDEYIVIKDEDVLAVVE